MLEGVSLRVVVGRLLKTLEREEERLSKRLREVVDVVARGE